MSEKNQVYNYLKCSPFQCLDIDFKRQSGIFMSVEDKNEWTGHCIMRSGIHRKSLDGRVTLGEGFK